MKRISTAVGRAVRAVVALGFLLVLSCSSWAREGGGDPFGERYLVSLRKGAMLGVAPLAQGATLSFVEGVSIPPESTEQVVLRVGEDSRPIATPADIAGLVQLDSEQAALDYLRFFDSYATSHMFARNYVEVFPECKELVCLPRKVWKRLGLPFDDARRESASSFLVRRLVMGPPSADEGVQVFLLTERVSTAGVVEQIARRDLKLSENLLSRLLYPSYL